MTFRTILFLGLLGGFILLAIVNRITEVSFCDIRYAVPGTCHAKSPNHIECDDFKMYWSYMGTEMFRYMPQQSIHQIEQGLISVSKEKISCKILNNKAEGFKISYWEDNRVKYLIVSYGIVNDKPVLVQLYLLKEPRLNTDLPEFARQIIRLD